MSSSRKRLVGAVGLAVAVTGLAVTPASANPAGTGLVISEVYGGGGNTSAVYTNDFIELYNPTGAAISVTGMSVQYRSASGTSVGSNITNLSGSVPAGAHYLVQEAAGTTVTDKPLPAPDATGTIAMAGGSGQVLLVNGTAASTVGTGDLAGNAALVDMVGYGSAGSYEGAPTGTVLTNATAATRSAAGADSDKNNVDFTTAAPAPENTSTPGGGGDPEPPSVVDKTIAEIQGTGATSPLVGQTVHTTGVVTAAYPTGGYNGFYIQTPGAGGDNDATPGASDAVFVYGSAVTAKVHRGDYVDVTGPVSEFAGTTEITPQVADDVSVLTQTVTAPVALATALPATEAAREAHEGELLAPTGPFTVTNNYTTHQYGEIGLAADTKPLVAPTEIADAQDTAAIQAVTDYNTAHAVTLDDGASVNYLSAANSGTPAPWLSKTNPIRVGTRAHFTAPVVLEYRNNLWKFQPTSQISDEGAGTATFDNTRTPAPENVGGDIRLATFNVLNYFPTTAADFVAMGDGRTCTTYKDREGNPITANTCSPDGPRGAADAANLQRQQDKIVTAINKLGAGIVSLEEIENSVQFGKDRDSAVSILVDALNTAAGSQVWAYVPSPAAADLPPLSAQDVIRTAFIYKPAQVRPVGGSKVLLNSTAFSNARQPLAQAFKATGTKDANAFAVIVNHFKSKGSGVDDGTGQGNANPDRVAQATALADFADSFKTERGLTKVFLTGDFNAYSMEDPIQVLESRGYHAIDSTTDPDEETYSFSGLSGSLDHVFANDSALPMVTGADVWGINSGESLAFEYSRYNYNVTEFYQADEYRASDHDPEVVGLDLAEAPSDALHLNLLTVNDFHGRINSNTVKWAGTVEQLANQEGDRDTLLVGAGDLIGASEFASAVDNDQPTIDMFNALGLDASAVGNHEFDKGWADLRDRVIGPDGARNAQWDYLGANVYDKGTSRPAMKEYATYDVEGVTVGVIGAVTEETKSLVSPGGISDLDFGNPVTAVNRVAGELSDGDPENGEADVIIAAFHAGATQGTGSNYDEQVAKGGEFAQMAGLNPAVDVIVNGHTHQVYAWDAPVPGTAGKARPIIQTGEYGTNVGQIKLTIDKATGDVQAYTAANVARTTTADSTLVSQYPRVAEVKKIVDAALAHAAEVGNQPVGQVSGDVSRALNNGSYVNGKWVVSGSAAENRAAESTIGDLVGNALRDGIPADMGDPDLGIVNPGGLRADLTYQGDTTNNPANTDGVVTYAEANGVLPFVNNIWLVDLTGAQLKAVLEQQWQPAGSSRPYLQLGLSDNVRMTADASKPAGERITSVTIDGQRLDPAKHYTVSTFSFLGTGGDNFTAFKQGTSKDTGLVDRDLWISYLQHAGTVSPDFARQQVFESGMPTSVQPGQHVELTLGTDLVSPVVPNTGETLDLISSGSPQNTTVEATWAAPGGNTTDLGSMPVTGGAANVKFDVPVGTGGGQIRLVAEPSGTLVTIPVATVEPTVSSVTATAGSMTYGTDGTVDVTVTPGSATGTVRVLDGTTVLGESTLSGGHASVTIPGDALEPGSHDLTVAYLGDDRTATSEGDLTLQVAKAASETTAAASPTTVKVKKGTSTVSVTVSAEGTAPTGTVEAYVGDTLLDSDTLSEGEVTLTVGPFGSVGTKDIQVRYLGDEHVSPSTASTAVTVIKATPKLDVHGNPKTIHVNRTTPVLAIDVAAAGLTPTGKVKVVSGDRSWTKTLSAGHVKFTLPAFTGKGAKDVTVKYLGDARTEGATRTITLKVVK